MRKLAHKYIYEFDSETKAQNIKAVFRKPFDIFADIAKKREVEKASHYTNNDNFRKYQALGIYINNVYKSLQKSVVPLKQIIFPLYMPKIL